MKPYSDIDKRDTVAYAVEHGGTDSGTMNLFTY